MTLTEFIKFDKKINSVPISIGTLQLTLTQPLPPHESPIRHDKEIPYVEIMPGHTFDRRRGTPITGTPPSMNPEASASQRRRRVHLHDS
jgi:hypothetical protein